MNKKEIKQAVEEGKIFCKVTFEIQGRPKQYIQEAQKTYLDNLKKEKDLVFVEENIEDVELVDEEKDVWSVICEADILFPNLEKITWMSLNFMPASIEVLKPEHFKFEARDIQNWLNDVVSKLHEVDLITKNLNSQNISISQNMGILIKNFIKTLISNKINNIGALSKVTGIPEDQIVQYLEHMVKSGELSKEKEDYKIESKKQG